MHKRLANIIKKSVEFTKKHEYVTAVFFFAALVIFFFFPVIFSGKTLVTSIFSGGVMPEGPYKYEGARPHLSPLRDPGAFNWQDEPLSDYIGKVIRGEHRVPIWNPNMGIGHPILGGIQLGIFFPLNYIVFFFSSEMAWDVFFLMRIFLAGFFTYVFARKIKLGKKPAFLAGVVFMFSGYVMNFLNMAHFSSEALIPLLLLSFEVLLDKQTLRRFLLSVLAIALVISPGMPEATAFAMILGILWLVFSLFFIHKKILNKRQVFLLFVAANILAFALLAIQLLPFTEFIKLSFNSHSDSTIGSNAIPIETIASTFYPDFFWPLYDWVASFYYLGIAAIILFFIALFSIRNFEKSERKKIIFFASFVFLMLAKVYGLSFINWIGKLPILDALIFPKYSAPAIIFSIAMVSAYGYAIIIRQRISFLNTKMVLILAAMIASTIFTLHAYMADIINRIAATDKQAKGLFTHYIGKFDFDVPKKFIDTISSSLSVPFLAFVIFSGILIFLIFWITVLNANRKNFPVVSILIFAILEFYVYAIPLERSDRYETYKKPPYVNFLQQEKNVFRVYGQMPNKSNSMLFPNTSSVFGIQDIRILMAMVDKRYFMFLKNVLGVKDSEINTVRFTGNSQIPFDNKFFDLLNVKYFISPTGVSDYAIADRISSQSKVLSDPDFFSPAVAKLNKKYLQGFLLHAPSKIEFPLHVDKKSLNFEYGIADEGIKGSDGVQFTVDIISGTATKQMLSDFIDPQDKKYKKWQKADLDLAPYFGKDVVVSLETKPGENNAYDQFFFGNFQASKDDIVYDKEMTITENKDVLPRSFVVHRAEKITDPDKIFARLKSDDFDIRNQIVIENDLPDEMLSGNNSPEIDSSTAMITSYKDQEVDIEAKIEHDGFLVLTDQYYPGWKAYVDGKETEIYSADYIFRSIYLKKGPHTVKFVYNPESYEVGKYISIAAILLIIGLLFYRKRINIALKRMHFRAFLSEEP